MKELKSMQTGYVIIFVGLWVSLAILLANIMISWWEIGVIFALAAAIAFTRSQIVLMRLKLEVAGLVDASEEMMKASQGLIDKLRRDIERLERATPLPTLNLVDPDKRVRRKPREL